MSIIKPLLLSSAAFALALAVSALPARAQDAKPEGKGTVTGTVVDKDAKPAEGVTVNLFKPRQGGGGSGGAAPVAPKSQFGHDAIDLQNRPTPIATATTDKDGKFEMKDVPAGQYMVGVRDQEKKLYGRTAVTVEADKTATVEIKCSDTPPQRNGGGGGGGGAAPKQ